MAHWLWVVLVCVGFVAALGGEKSHLIQQTEEGAPEWMSKKEMLALKEDGVSFMDITNFQDLGEAAVPSGPPLPNQPQQKRYVRSLLRKLDMNNMRANVETLSSFHTRFYATQTGMQAAEYIYSTATAYASNRKDVTITFFNSTTTAPQPSVIARYEAPSVTLAI